MSESSGANESERVILPLITSTTAGSLSRISSLLTVSSAASFFGVAVTCAIVASERPKLAAADFAALDDATRETVRVAFADAYVAGFRALARASALLAALGALTVRVSMERARRVP